MKMNRLFFALFALLVAIAMASPANAQTVRRYNPVREHQYFRGAIKFAREQVFVTTSTTITSPTLTVNVAKMGLVSLQSDANCTGIRLIGGVKGQVVEIVSGSGSNTIRFDDATSMSLGSNITLTEGQNDVAGFICLNDEGDEWAAIHAHDN